MVLYSSFNADITLRLQQLVAGWRGAERGQPLSVLHGECVNAAGPGGRYLLPAVLLFVKDLDETHLQMALRGLNGRWRGNTLRFRVRVAGRFDAALVPIGQGGGLADHWLLAVEERLPVCDQVALYGHGLGHLLLNREAQKMDQLPPLDLRDGYAHIDMLAELRLLETVRQLVDRRVLETYPVLTELLVGREEQPSVLDTTLSDLRQLLAKTGWRGQQYVESPYIFTQGRVYIRESATQHGKKLRVDALLRAQASLPIAVVQTIHAGQTREEVILRLIEYAHSRLAVPFAYLLEADGSFLEFDWSVSEEPVETVVTALPGREALLNRWLRALSLTDNISLDALRFPYQSSGPKPRYYQETAINRAVIAVLQAKRNLRKPRILLTLATGTGKTKVAFQLLWKLKRSRAIHNVLFITDRDYLLSQAMDNEFAPFGDARARVLGEAVTSRDIVFATYQSLVDSEMYAGLYHDYPRNFFDVIIVDECHRGSAQADSVWRDILEYFEGAIQVGLTATPLSTDLVQTDEYFGTSLYTYSLHTGINDGFLAPYRVRRIQMGQKQGDEGGTAVEASDTLSNGESGTFRIEDEKRQDNIEILQEETSASLRMLTPVIAQHLAGYLQRTDPFAKTIVFCADQDHAQQMREALAQACAAYVKRYPNYVERIVSDEGVEGKRALGRFSTPAEKTPVIVTTSRLLSTGVDVPTCKNIVLARPVGSLVEFKQIIGRGTRLYEPDKTWFTIIDYAGAIKLFFDPNFDGDPELVEVEPLIPHLQQEISTAPAGETKVEDVPPTSSQAEEQLTSTNEHEDQQAVTPAAEQTMQGADVREAMVQNTNKLEVNERHADYIEEQASEEGYPLVEMPPSMTEEHGDAQQKVGEMPSFEVGETGICPHLPVLPGSAVQVFSMPGSTPPPPLVTKQTKDGRTIQVIGEYVYDLAPDGKTLLPRANYRDYTAKALHKLIATTADLRARWLVKEQREELLDRLAEEGVDLPALAEALSLTDVDPLDLLLHVAFGEAVVTRSERVERLYRNHADFFERYTPEARVIFDVILKKYVDGEAKDVSDTGHLKVPPLSERGTFIELVQSFGGGTNLRNALKEMQRLLYQEVSGFMKSKQSSMISNPVDDRTEM